MEERQGRTSCRYASFTALGGIASVNETARGVIVGAAQEESLPTKPTWAVTCQPHCFHDLPSCLSSFQTNIRDSAWIVEIASHKQRRDDGNRQAYFRVTSPASAASSGDVKTWGYQGSVRSECKAPPHNPKSRAIAPRPRCMSAPPSDSWRSLLHLRHPHVERTTLLVYRPPGSRQHRGGLE